ncbi:MAG: DUF4837 family protein [Gemmatimonadota bacterium]|nr:DUF4837 family protein [Gemmatimonadota bacterium]
MFAVYEIFDAVSRVTVSSALDGLWKGMVVTLAVACLLNLARWMNARTRYVIWTAALVVVFVLPWSGIWNPPDRAATARMWFEAMESNDYRKPGSPTPDDADASESSPGADQPKHRDRSGPASAPEPRGWWPPAVFAVWMLVALALSARLSLGFRLLRRLKRSAKPLPARYQDRLRRLIRSCETRRWVCLCSSAHVDSPAATGLFRPVILIPESMPERLTEAEFDQVVLHELAHLHRLDDWSRLFQAIVGCVLFFHPAVWWIARRMDLEREVACDDMVVGATGGARAYAACLTRLTEMMASPVGSRMCIGAAEDRKQVVRRVSRLLNGRRGAEHRLSRSGLLLASGLILMVLMQCGRMGPAVEIPGRSDAYVKLAGFRDRLLSFIRLDRLPPGSGRVDLVTVIADSLDARTFQQPFLEAMEREILTPRKERLYHVSFVRAGDFRALRRRNIVIAAPLDGVHEAAGLVRSLVPQEHRDAMRNGADPFVIRRDVWAHDQVVVLVTGEDHNALRDNIMTEADRIYSAIDGRRDERVAENLFRFGERETLASELADRFGWRVRIPFGFNLIDTHADSGFVVFTRTHARVTQWMFVYREDGVRPDRLTEAWCVRKRNEIAAKFFENDIVDPTGLTVSQRELGSRLAVHLEGLWQNDLSWKGGPFRSYVLVEEKKDRLYFLDLGVYRPNRRKETFLRQLDVIARTFETGPFYEDRLATTGPHVAHGIDD